MTVARVSEELNSGRSHPVIRRTGPEECRGSTENERYADDEDFLRVDLRRQDDLMPDRIMKLVTKIRIAPSRAPASPKAVR